jgi:hypothetical protein
MTRKSLQGSLFLLVSMVAGVALGAQNYPTVSYKDAADHIDEIVWIEGTILKAETAPEGIYLVFNANEKYVRLLVPKANVETFEGSIAHKYTGKKVKAVGKVSKYGHRLIVGVNEPKRIKILENEAT